MIKVHFNYIRLKILRELRKSKKSISIAVYWFTNKELFNSVLDLLDSGVNVNLIIHNDYINTRNTGLNFQDFIDRGGKFYYSNSSFPMHNKFCIIDDRTLINGSYNWTYYAEERNFENILIIKKNIKILNAFKEEYEKLIESSNKINNYNSYDDEHIIEHAKHDLRDYISYDILYESGEKGLITNVNSAIRISPHNISLQKQAVELHLLEGKRLKHAIGASLKDDRYLILLPKDTSIPYTNTEIAQTSEDNQTSSSSTIHFGENSQASLNPKLGKLRVVNIPPKLVGEAKLKYTCSIDIYGNLKIHKESVDSGYSDHLNININNLIE